MLEPDCFNVTFGDEEGGARGIVEVGACVRRELWIDILKYLGRQVD